MYIARKTAPAKDEIKIGHEETSSISRTLSNELGKKKIRAFQKIYTYLIMK